MAYCTQNDLIARGWEEELISLSDKAGLYGGTMDDAALDQAISDASAEIDSYLIGHIPLPIAQPSEFLVRKACDMVRFYLYDIGVIEPVAKRYEAAIRFLKGVADGSTMISSLIDTSNNTVDTSINLIQKPKITASASVFSDSLLEKM
jgi:phage gp36-like protein